MLNILENIPERTFGKRAIDEGLGEWRWDHITDIPIYTGSKGVAFSQNQLFIDAESNEKSITNQGNYLRFYVDPLSPRNENNWSSEPFNFRSEIRTNSWPSLIPDGTEEYIGYSVIFGKGYKIDTNNDFNFYQNYPSEIGAGVGPTIGMVIARQNQNGQNVQAGHLMVVVDNDVDPNDYYLTNIFPKAGDKLDIVKHIVYSANSNIGQLRVWINGELYYNRNIRTITSGTIYGGNHKFGIYKSNWRDYQNILLSLADGVDHQEMFMGPLRILTRLTGNPDIGTEGYSLVNPSNNSNTGIFDDTFDDTFE